MKNRPLLAVLIVLLSAMPLLLLYMQYPGFPETIAVHFGLNGKADRYAEKSQAWMIIGLLSGVSIAAGILLLFITRIDPKFRDQSSQGTFNKIAIVVTFFLSALNCYIIFSLPRQHLPASGVHLIMCLFFSVLGNYMYNVKPNYWVGIRTPWTLESEVVWRKTHHLAGRLWFVGGMVLAALLLLLPEQVSRISFLAGIGVLALVPVLYSIVIYKNQIKA